MANAKSDDYHITGIFWIRQEPRPQGIYLVTTACCQAPVVDKAEISRKYTRRKCSANCNRAGFACGPAGPAQVYCLSSFSDGASTSSNFRPVRPLIVRHRK